MAQVKISEAGEHGAVANNDRIPASVGPFTPGTRGYHQVSSIQAKFNSYSNTLSTLVANNFKVAIDELDAKCVGLSDDFIPIGYLDTDVTLAANSDIKVPSQKAIKAFVNAKVAANISFSNAASQIGSNTVQGAIDALDTRVDTIEAWEATDLPYSNTGSDLESEDVGAALDELAGRTAAVEGDYIPLSYLDTDGTLAANSDTKVASQRAVKTYVDQIIAAQDAMVFQGVIDASANPNYPAASRGHTYRISVAGKIGGASGPNVEVGDLIICLTDSTSAGNQATVGSAWTITQTNIDGAVVGPASVTGDDFAQFDGTSGKLIKGGLSLDNDNTLDANSATRVPTQQAVKVFVEVIESELDSRLSAVEGDYVPLDYLDTDETLAANSDSKVATQQATKVYVDTEVAKAKVAANISYSNTASEMDGTTVQDALDTVDGRLDAVEGDYIPLSYLDTDVTLAANSNAKVASQQAVKVYVDGLLAASDAMVYRGVIDASTNPNYPAGDAGDTYRISVAGKIGGASGPNVQVGDIIICLTDETASGDHATVGIHWNIVQTNIDGAVTGPASSTDNFIPQWDGTSGKILKAGVQLDNDGTLAANSASRLATQQAVKVYVDDAIDSVGGTPDAEDVSYANAASTLAAANVQGAIDELDVKIEAVASIPTTYAAANVTYSNTGSTLAADDVQAAIDEIDTKVVGLVAAADAMVFKGVIDCSANPNYPAADRGHTYRVSVAGKIGGASGPNVEVGDLIICLTDATSAGDHATVGTSWTISQSNIDGAVVGPASSTDNFIPQWDGTTGKLLKAGMQFDNDSTLTANSATRIPSQQAVKVYVDAGLAVKEPLGEFYAIDAKTADYVLALADKGKVIEVANDTAANITVPNNDTIAFPVKSRIDIISSGTGDIRIVAGTGVTLRSKDSNTTISAQWAGASLYKRATDEWVLIGDLTSP
jgi:hypothetical protein